LPVPVEDYNMSDDSGRPIAFQIPSDGSESGEIVRISDFNPPIDFWFEWLAKDRCRLLSSSSFWAVDMKLDESLLSREYLGTKLKECVEIYVKDTKNRVEKWEKWLSQFEHEEQRSETSQLKGTDMDLDAIAEEASNILDYVEQEPEQTLVPDGRVNNLRKLLGRTVPSWHSDSS